MAPSKTSIKHPCTREPPVPWYICGEWDSDQDRPYWCCSQQCWIDLLDFDVQPWRGASQVCPDLGAAMRMKIEEPTFTLFPAEGDDNRVAFGSMTDMNNYLEGLAGEVSFEHVQIPPETVEALNRHGFTCPTKQNAFRVLSESTGTLSLVGVIIAHLADGTICDVPCRHCTAVVHQTAS